MEYAAAPLGHAFGPPGGPFTHVAVGIDHQWVEGRFWEAPDGTIYVLGAYGSGVAGGALDADGLLQTDISETGVPWSRIFLVKGRSSAAGAPYLEGLYELPGEDAEMALHYFRMDPSLRVGTTVTEAADATP